MVGISGSENQRLAPVTASARIVPDLISGSTGANRWFSLPEIPTMIESGYPGFVSDTFNALFAPAGTPQEILDLLLKQAKAAMASPEAVEAAHRAGYQIIAGDPDQLTRRVVTEIQGVKELVARAGIKPEN